MNAEVKRRQIVAAAESRTAPRGGGRLAPPDLRVLHGTAYGGESAGRLSQALHLRPRQAFFLLVLLLHAGLLAVLLMPRDRNRLELSLPSIEAQVISDAPAQVAAPPPTPLTLERPHIDVITPDVPITEPAPDAPIAAPPQPTVQAAVAAAPAKPEAAPVTPITPPRFDAAYLKNPPPVYPVAARRMHEHGTVLVRVRVLQQGTAADVLIERSSGSQLLDEAAMEAVRHWRFVPARRGTEAVEAWVLVPLEFELRR